MYISGELDLGHQWGLIVSLGMHWDHVLLCSAEVMSSYIPRFYSLMYDMPIYFFLSTDCSWCPHQLQKTKPSNTGKIRQALCSSILILLSACLFLVRFLLVYLPLAPTVE